MGGFYFSFNRISESVLNGNFGIKTNVVKICIKEYLFNRAKIDFTKRFQNNN